MKLQLSLLICLCCVFSAGAQQNQVRFQQLTANSGLSQGHILCLLQDRDGYVWAGTYNGLNRFDGYNFEVFYSDANNPNSLTINVVFSLFEDKAGKIWCGTWGIDIFDPSTGSFVKHIPAEKGPNSISGGEISSIDEDEYGNMWFGTRNGGLNKYDPVTDSITWFRPGINNKHAQLSDHINDIHADKKAKLWIATEGGGISVLNLENEKFRTFRHIDSDPHSLPSDNISCLFEDRDGIIWAGDNEGNLLEYSPGNQSFTSYSPWEGIRQGDQFRIMQIAQGRDGKLLLATNGMGMLEYDPKLNKSRAFLHDGNNSESLISNENRSILVTSNNTVFIGSYGRGISVFSPGNNKFDVYKISGSGTTGTEINAFTDAIEDKSDHLITGSYDGFLVFDKKTWNYRHYLPGNSYEENKILTLAMAPDSTLWLSSPKFIYRYDKDFRKIASYTFGTEGKDNSIYSIVFDYYNNLWIGLFSEGLIKIKEKEWRNLKKTRLDYRMYVSDYNDSTTISGNQQWVIFNDIDSNLWLGGVGGLDRYNYSGDNFSRVFYPGTIKTIDRDREGKLWLGTIGNGLFCYNPANSENKRFTTRDGLPHSFIYGVIADSFNNIWITTEGGLSRLNISSGEFRTYDKRDGLPDDHFDDKSESPLADGSFYMGTNNGFVIFRPGQISDDTSKVKCALTGLYIDNKKISHLPDLKTGNNRDIPVSHLKEINLMPSQRDIEFHFAALQFSAPHRVKYAYILQGYDKEWIYTDASKRIAKYTNLGGGKYTFMVKATNCDGRWTLDPLMIQLIVHPPFLKTIPFKVFTILILLASFIIYFRLRLVKEKKQNLILAEKVKVRTQEISEKNNQLNVVANNLKETNARLKENQLHIEKQSEQLMRQRDILELSNATKDKLFSVIAHDLKAPFNVILGYNELLIEKFREWDKEKQLSVLELLKESSEGAYALLENLLQWSQSQSGAMRFNPVEIKINEIINTVLPDVQLFAKKKGINIHNLAENNETLIMADINMMNTILRNLVINAIKYSQRNKTVEINTRQENESIVFSVRDEGMGMAGSEAANLFNLATSKSNPGTEGEKGTGIGLLLCMDFVRYHKGLIWVESELNKGTTVFFSIEHQ